MPALPDPTPLQAAALAELERSGPMELEALADRLAAAGLDLGEFPLEDLDEALLERDDIGELPDGTLCHLATAIDGAVATRYLTSEELRTGIVAVETDLELLVLPVEGAFGLPGGGVAQLELTLSTEDEPGRWRLLGPEGWLAHIEPGALTAFRLDGRLLRVEACPADVAQAAVDDAVDALRDTFAEYSPYSPQMEITDLLLAVLIDDPAVLRTPRPPLSELLDETGLERYGDWIGAPGAFDDPDAGLDEHSREGLSLLLSALGLAASQEDGLDQLRGNRDLAGHLAGILSRQALTEAFIATALGPLRDPGATAAVEAWATAIASAAPGHTGPHLVLAACAEQRGDAESAEARVGDVLRVDPDDPLALYDAAWCAEDRGEAARGVSLLRRAGVDHDDAQLQRLEAYALPGPAFAGRNEPCPCGSGRKYKVCCAQRNGYPLADRVFWLLAKAGEFLLRPGQRGLVDVVAVARSGGDPDDPRRVEVATHDPMVTDLALFEGGLLGRFCDERGPLLPADELELARSWLGAPMGLHEVAGVAPGHGLTLRNLSTGAHVEVRDVSGSTQVTEGVLLLARPLPVGESHVLAPAAMEVPFTVRDALLSVLDGEPDAVEIAAWLAAAQAPARLTTTDGDPMVACSLRLRVDDPHAAARALDAILDGGDGWWARHGERQHGRVLLGEVTIGGDIVEVRASSEPRFEALIAELAVALPRAELVDEERVPGPSGHAVGPPSGGAPVRTQALDTLVAEADEAVAAFIAEAEERWVDESIPALGGSTPRQAAADPTRRDDLERLLAQFAQFAESQGDALPGDSVTFDAARLRRLLGLDA